MYSDNDRSLLNDKGNQARCRTEVEGACPEAQNTACLSSVVSSTVSLRLRQVLSDVPGRALANAGKRTSNTGCGPDYPKVYCLLLGMTQSIECPMQNDRLNGMYLIRTKMLCFLQICSRHRVVMWRFSETCEVRNGGERTRLDGSKTRVAGRKGRKQWRRRDQLDYPERLELNLFKGDSHPAPTVLFKG